MNTVILALDRSGCSVSALEATAGLLRGVKAEVLVVHVVDPAADGEMRTACERLLIAAAQELEKSRIAARTLLAFGDPAEQVTRIASDRAVVAVVMGSHGRSGWRRFALGSTTESVVRRAAVPVIVVQGAREPVTSPERHEILVALDGSACSARALDRAIDLAALMDRTLYVVSVVDAATILEAYEMFEAESEIARAQRTAMKLLTQTLARARASGVRAQGAVLMGSPALEIVGCARRRGADVIVAGTHGRSGLRRLFMGSVAEAILESSPIPVALVRGQDNASAIAS